MDSTEITLGIGVVALIVKSIADHLMSGSKTEQVVRKIMDTLVADLRREHADCRQELDDLRKLIVDITPDRDPAE
jgi:uncharacterized membrane protein